MTTVDEAKQYMNILARGLKLVELSPVPHYQIYTISEYDEVSEELKTKMDSYWNSDNQEFLKNIESLLHIIEQEEKIERKTSMALEFCKWLDFKITYMANENSANGERQFFSLYSLVPLKGEGYVEIDSLNTNWEETGIWINPKFEIALPYVKYDEEVREKNIANRDIFEGANGFLVNCSYFIADNKHKVKNIVFSNCFLSEKDSPNLRIAFSPLSDRSDLIKTKEETLLRNGVEFVAESVEPIQDAEELLQRLESDWKMAGELKTDVFFAPELMGTEMSEKNDGFYNEAIRKWSCSRLGEGKEVPMLTVLPTYWYKNHNSATLVDSEGRIVARQEKRIPFVDRKSNRMEALCELDEWSTVLIHIQGVHRIAVLICAEFLAKETQRLQEFICGRLGATLVIVPSYSHGEQDFINELSSLKSYGTTVIWGNCCGAIKGKKRAIGGCGIAGTTQTIVFGSKCQCNFSCKNISACIFVVEIPLNFELRKTEEIKQQTFVKHIIN